jgi:carbonic anhydrase
VSDELRPISITWSEIRNATLFDNSHIVQVNVDDAVKPTLVDPNTGKTYSLLQFHFHAPSEHTFGSSYRDMEMQLVHRTPSGKDILVVAVTFIATAADDNQFLDHIWKELPTRERRDRHSDAHPVKIRPALHLRDVVPLSRSYVHYVGSLTSPPCTEGVRWYALQQPLTISKAQLRRLRDALDLPERWAKSTTRNHDGDVLTGNARPIQPLHGRIVTRYIDSSRDSPAVPANPVLGTTSQRSNSALPEKKSSI